MGLSPTAGGGGAKGCCAGMGGTVLAVDKSNLNLGFASGGGGTMGRLGGGATPLGCSTRARIEYLTSKFMP